LAGDRADQESAHLATAADDFATCVAWTSEGVDLINDIPAASQFIERVIAQAVETLTSADRLDRWATPRSN
jgi:hypothetical protein